MYTSTMTEKEIFTRLGFRKHASQIYEVLRESPKPMLVTYIAGSLGLSRAEIYRNLEKFLHEKFVKKVQLGKRTYYQAESPHRIEESFMRVAREVSSVTLKQVRKREKEIPEHIKYFKGFSGIRAVFDDSIQHTARGGTLYRYTSEQDLAKVNQYLSPDYRVKRDTKKIERLVISNPVSGKQKKSRLERFIKYIHPDAAMFDQNVIQLVYGSRLAFINLTTEEAYVIEDKALADFQTVIFKQLYKKL